MMTIPMPRMQGVCEVVHDSKLGYSLNYKMPRYEEPPKYYGEIADYRTYLWSSFMRHKFKIGCMFLGSPGSGKTELAKSLCNLAIDRGLMVVELTSIDFKPELISFLDSLTGVVLFFDEFSKTFGWQGQQKMLTLLSNTSGAERIILITENDPASISSFIRNRPGRVRYSLLFDKISKRTVTEYLMDYRTSASFVDELFDLYGELMEFTFDHLQALVTEHLDSPNMSIDDMLVYLNLDFIKGDKVLELESITVKGKQLTDEEYTMVVMPDMIKLDSVKERMTVHVSAIPKPKDGEEPTPPMPPQQYNPFGARSAPNQGTGAIEVRLKKRNIISRSNDSITFEKDGIIVEFNIILKRT